MKEQQRWNEPAARPSVSIVLPAFNESHRLPSTLETMRPYLMREFPKHEVIVVDDGSSDRTADIVSDISKSWPEMFLLKQPKNIGKGAAVKRGMLAATSDLIMFMDSDLATPLEEMENMLPHFASGFYKAVVGVRTYQHDDSKWRRIMGLSLQILTHLIVFDRAVVDSQCGFKMFGRQCARDVFSRVRINGGMFDVEIFSIMHRLGIPIIYQPVHWANKAGSRINILKCVTLDVFDMMAVRINGRLGKYTNAPVGSENADAIKIEQH